jgi:DNA polymerase-3 subunit epsilon
VEFVAIDFETATPQKDSACAVGAVLVRGLDIIEEYYTLIQPPNNEYNFYNTRVHGIRAKDTVNAPTFPEIYPKLKSLIQGKRIVAHNAAFDQDILYHTMLSFGLNFNELKLPRKWDCTVKLYKRKGLLKVNLAACSKLYGIELHHHNALSDAKACAKLYMIHHNPLFSHLIPQKEALRVS